MVGDLIYWHSHQTMNCIKDQKRNNDILSRHVVQFFLSFRHLCVWDRGRECVLWDGNKSRFFKFPILRQGTMGKRGIGNMRRINPLYTHGKVRE